MASNKKINTQIRRIRRYEEIFREVTEKLKEEGASLDAQIRELEAYYTSPEWKQDFAADEAGLLPSDLPRGVLSEDGIYNVLEEYTERQKCCPASEAEAAEISGTGAQTAGSPADDPVLRQLFALQDPAYRDFQAKLIPTVSPEKMIGVRTPELRALAKRLKKEDPQRAEAFLAELPHTYFDEDQLHAFLLSEEKSFEKCVALTEAFLPYVDNWATCDQLSPKVFGKNTDRLLPYIRKWIDSGKTYTIRFGVGMLMQHYFDGRFDPAYPELVSKIRSDEYYVNMMTAWYFATALAKQYEAVLPYIQEQRLDAWTHNKAIQKAVESRRITPEQKEYLKSLKIRKNRKS